MPRTKVIAKMDCLPFFRKGDEMTIIPVLHEQDTLIRDQINGVFDEEETMVKIYDAYTDSRLPKVVSGKWKVKKIFDPLYAPKGSYKDSYIETSEGNQYPSSLFGRYEDFFEKIY